MASLAGSLFASYAVPTMAHYLAEQDLVITYTDLAGSDTDLTDVILGIEETQEEIGEDGRKIKHVRTITVPRTEGSAFATVPPAVNATVTIDDVPYAIDAVTSWTENLVGMRLVKRLIRETTKPGYRRKP